jgi:hypothetical protein
MVSTNLLTPINIRGYTEKLHTQQIYTQLSVIPKMHPEIKLLFLGQLDIFSKNHCANFTQNYEMMQECPK